MLSKDFQELARNAAHRTAPENFTVADVDKAFAEELKNYCGSINQFMKNRYDLYEIIIQNADEIVPAKVIDQLGAFAEVRQIGQGQKAMFRVGKDASKMRAKRFLTQVGLAGVYEAFRLDSSEFEVSAHAIGGAAMIDFERMLDGAETLAEVMEVITEGLTDAVYYEVQKALKAALTVADMPGANRVIETGFDKDKMFALCSVVRAYGRGAVIFAPPEFVAAMGPDDIVPISDASPKPLYPGIYPQDDIDSIHRTGYIQLFRGTPIVQFRQSFVDTENDKTWIDPQIAYVLPTGGEKIVKVVFEGQTQMYDWTNKDNGMEVEVYKKLGVAILTYNNWGIYQNSNIPQTQYNPYPNL